MPTISESQARKMGILVDDIKKRSKYRAVPTIYNGVRYASKSEAKRAEELDLMVLAGQAMWYIRQPSFTLGVPENRYVADFLVCMWIGDDAPWGQVTKCHVEDVKGHRTQKFNRDLKLWRAYGPMCLHVISKGKTEIIPGRS